MTAQNVGYVDRTLPDVPAVLDALSELDESLPDERLVRLCRVLYPAIRVRVAYSPSGDPQSVTTTTDVLVDGRGRDRNSHLAPYAEEASAPQSVSVADHYDLGTDAGPESTLSLDFDCSDRDAVQAVEDAVRDSKANTDLHQQFGLPENFDPDGFAGIEDATRLYLPFWIAEFADGTPDDDRILALRDIDWIGGDGPAKEAAWLSSLVARDSELLSQIRTIPELSDQTREAGREVVVPDDVELSVSSVLEANPDRCFADVGGMEELKSTLTELVVDPLAEPEKYERYDLGVTNGVLFHGPPGCGKTYVAEALAGELDRHFLEISPSDLTSKWVGEAADNVADLFDVARANSPCLVFIDEIDAVASDRGGQMTNTEQQMVNQLLTELEGASDDDVVVLAATNLVDDVDGAILRSGRFDERIEVPPPDADAREAILDVHLAGRPTVEDLSLTEAVRRTEGYAASDLELVAERAARAALADDADIDADHLGSGIEEVETSIPSWLDRYDHVELGAGASERDDGLSVPASVSLPATELIDPAPSRDFDGVPGMERETTTLRERVLDPIERAEQYESYGVESLSGVLLYGPPGCGKTFLSRAAAGELGWHFLRVTPTQLAVEWEGSPAENVGEAFELAEANAPCLVFLDDLDALAPTGRNGGEGGVTHRLAAELAAVPEDVLVVGATHLVEDVADSVLRAGCFDERIEVPPPSRATCEAVLQTAVDERLIGDVEWERVTEQAVGHSVGDLRLVAESAARAALRDDHTATTEDFLAALDSVGSSIADWHARGRYAESEFGSDLRNVR
ncbi:ATP-binding protein [Halorussus halophilus]|uniref:ATP-binding protein n=1 Tax=Halorussus halophilus TaxID=2650975 RepID=UPI00130188D9|nr:ATP-binding protein [Halorussus halophilus]